MKDDMVITHSGWKGKVSVMNVVLKDLPPIEENYLLDIDGRIRKNAVSDEFEYRGKSDEGTMVEYFWLDRTEQIVISLIEDKTSNTCIFSIASKIEGAVERVMSQILPELNVYSIDELMEDIEEKLPSSPKLIQDLAVYYSEKNASELRGHINSALLAKEKNVRMSAIRAATGTKDEYFLHKIRNIAENDEDDEVVKWAHRSLAVFRDQNPQYKDEGKK